MAGHRKTLEDTEFEALLDEGNAINDAGTVGSGPKNHFQMFKRHRHDFKCRNMDTA